MGRVTMSQGVRVGDLFVIRSLMAGTGRFWETVRSIFGFAWDRPRPSI